MSDLSVAYKHRCQQRGQPGQRVVFVANGDIDWNHLAYHVFEQGDEESGVSRIHLVRFSGRSV
eukprot:11211221-Lingulodinium_polyedra.AAC.1